jgi:hypothetical protein
MTIPQVMAFSSVISDVGLTNQQGASSFSQILRMMASQSEKFAEAIGMPVEKFQQAIRTNAMDALGMLIGKFRELNEVDPIKAQEFISGLGFRGVKTAGALQQLSSMFEDVQKRTAMAVEEEETLGSLIAGNALKADIRPRTRSSRCRTRSSSSAPRLASTCSARSRSHGQRSCRCDPRHDQHDFGRDRNGTGADLG